MVIGKAGSSDGDVIDNHGVQDYWVIKLTSTGDVEWKKTYGGNSTDVGEEICQTNDGGYVMVGTGRYNTAGDITGHHGGLYDFWVAKINSAGDLIWQRALGGSSLDYGRSITLTSDGGCIAGGETLSNDGDVSNLHSENYRDAWVVKLNELGELVWQRTLGGTNDDVCFSIQQTADEGFVTAGYNWSNDGDATFSHGYNEFWIVKLSPESSPTLAPQATQLQIFPNPTSNKIHIITPENSPIISVRVCDLMGRELSRQHPYSGEVDISGLPEGLYIMSVTTSEGQVWVEKICRVQ